VATGVGAAGVPDVTSDSFDRAPNLSALVDASFRTRLAALLGHPVSIDNDVNVAALGELRHGIGRHVDNFVFVAVGTGIGMGIVANGQIIRGARGAAGEIGYLPLGADPLDTDNHRRGPLEEMVAGQALADRYRATTGEVIAAPEIVARATAGDKQAADTLDLEARWLATALVAVAAVLDPEVFVMGGGLGSQPELLDRIKPWQARLGAPGLDLRLSTLKPEAAVAGALCLARETARLGTAGPGGTP